MFFFFNGLYFKFGDYTGVTCYPVAEADSWIVVDKFFKFLELGILDVYLDNTLNIKA